MPKTAKKIRIRYGLPEPKKLLKNLKFFAKEKGTSLNKEIEFYIKGRLGDVEKSKEKIEGEEMRIQKIRRCIEIAINLVDGEDYRKILRNHFLD